MDQARVDQLYRDHGDAVYAFVVSRTGDRMLAEDLTGDVFERVLRSRAPFDPRRSKATTWLFTIALNLVRDHHRRQSTRDRTADALWSEPADSGTPGPDEGVERRDEVRRAMAVLSDDERDVVSLRFGADLTAPQIAAVTGERLTTVEGRLYRALRKLRDALEEPADTLSRS